MSHGKFNKRGYSLYLENWNPNAKKYINICKLCGTQGYSPVIDQPDFSNNNDKIFDAKNAVIRRELRKSLRPLPLDDLGRCPDCARVQDGK